MKPGARGSNSATPVNDGDLIDSRVFADGCYGLGRSLTGRTMETPGMFR